MFSASQLRPLQKEFFDHPKKTTPMFCLPPITSRTRIQGQQKITRYCFRNTVPLSQGIVSQLFQKHCVRQESISPLMSQRKSRCVVGLNRPIRRTDALKTAQRVRVEDTKSNSSCKWGAGVVLRRTGFFFLPADEGDHPGDGQTNLRGGWSKKVVKFTCLQGWPFCIYSYAILSYFSPHRGLPINLLAQQTKTIYTMTPHYQFGQSQQSNDHDLCSATKHTARTYPLLHASLICLGQSNLSIAMHQHLHSTLLRYVDLK